MTRTHMNHYDEIHAPMSEFGLTHTNMTMPSTGSTMTNTNKIQHRIPIPASIGPTQYSRARFRRTDADTIHV